MDQNRGLFICLAAAIVGFGIVMVYSASVTSWPTEFERVHLSRQVLALAIGILIATVCAVLPARFWSKAAPYLLALTGLLLLAVLIPKLGTRVNGRGAGCGGEVSSSSPRNWQSSYCPCFCAGRSNARRIHGDKCFCGSRFRSP